MNFSPLFFVYMACVKQHSKNTCDNVSNIHFLHSLFEALFFHSWPTSATCFHIIKEACVGAIIVSELCGSLFPSPDKLSFAAGLDLLIFSVKVKINVPEGKEEKRGNFLDYLSTVPVKVCRTHNNSSRVLINSIAFNSKSWVVSVWERKMDREERRKKVETEWEIGGRKRHSIPLYDSCFSRG